MSGSSQTCFGQGGHGPGVLVAATPVADWGRDRGPLDRVVSDYAAR